MDRINPDKIRQLLNEGTQKPSESTNVSESYAAAVMDQLNRYFAGNPARPIGEEFDVMVETWTITLQDVVPESRFPEVFKYARANRSSNFIMDVSEVCGAWRTVRESERQNLPRIGQYDYRGTSVCPKCNGTGTKPFVKRDPVLGRDYTYGAHCNHE